MRDAHLELPLADLKTVAVVQLDATQNLPPADIGTVRLAKVSQEEPAVAGKHRALQVRDAFSGRAKMAPGSPPNEEAVRPNRDGVPLIGAVRHNQ